MSPTVIAACLALVVSLLSLLLIARRDPKRLRSLAAASLPTPMSARARRRLTLAVLLPGVMLIVLGYWPAFLIWLGGLIASGWLMVQLLAARR